MIGERISHYRILEELDQGGMGVIYKAEDVNLGRPAALKFLPAAMCEDEELKDRFILEAKAASALDHPNICTIYEIGKTDEGHLFIAMAYYKGETLHKKISRGPLDQNTALDYVTQIAAGLAKSHELDIIHRDIKPANIFITSDGQVKILDFGLAKMLGEGVTLSGLAQGTPAYMAPERIRNERANPKTDLWSLGVLLQEALTGERPFSGRSVADIIQSVHEDPPAPLTALQPKTSPELAAIVAKLLRKNPKKRYASCEDLLWDLEDLSTGKRPSSRKAAWVSAWISASLVLFLVLASIGTSCWLVRRGPAPAVISNKLAILSFENTSVDPTLDWMSQGVPDLLLLSDTAEPARIGKKLAQRVGVDYVLSGRVAESSGVPLIEIHLFDTRNGKKLLSRTVEIKGQDTVFSHIDNISFDIRQQLEPTHHLRYDEHTDAEGRQALADEFFTRFRQLWKDGDLEPGQLSAKFP